MHISTAHCIKITRQLKTKQHAYEISNIEHRYLTVWVSTI